MPTLFDYLERSGNGAVVTSEEIATALVDYLAEMTIDFTNLKTQKQSEEYARLYEEVLNELIQMGVPFD